MRRILRSFFISLTGLIAVFSGLLLYAYSNTPASTVNRTAKTTTIDSASCGQCHSPLNANIVATFTAGSPPSQLYPGDYGNYRITISKSGDTTSTVSLGIDVAASDTVAALTVTGGEPTTTAAALGVPEVTHVSGGILANLRRLNTVTNYYSFRYTMPASAGAGTTHTLYGVAALGPSTGGGWNRASNFAITTRSLPAAATSITPSSPTSSTINLIWSGGGPQYLVLRKTGSDPSSPTDPAATSVYSGSGTSATASGLSASTIYYFAVFSKDLGVHSGAAFYSTTAATNNMATTAAFDPNPWVDAVSGNDTNNGTSGAPLRTIKKALTVVGFGGTIRVRPGTYNTTLGETFPITIPSAVKLQSTAGAASTIIDASGANPRTRVLYCTANSNTTLVEGFTITGGLFTAPRPQSSYGGGILTEGGDQTTISRCIITGNQGRGYDGDSFYTVGGQASGGGIASLNSPNKFTSCIIRNNVARGGDGATTVSGGVTGGEAYGGGVYATGAATFINNTFYGNQSLGGKGGDATAATGGTGGNAWYGALYAFSGIAQNNIFASNSVTGGIGGSPGGSTGSASTGGINASSVSYNLFYNNGTGGDGTTGTNAITGQDPLFISTSDLHLRSSSPARLAGTSTGAPTVDLENNPRTSPPTIGAYEIGLFLTAIGGIGRITVTWPGVSGASSYNLYMSQSPGVTTSSTKVTGATSPYVLSALPNNTTYYFVMTAVENGVEGPISPEVSATTSNGTWVKAVVSGTGFTNLTLDLASGTTLYATATDSAGVYKSTDSGDTWTALTGPVSNGTLRAVAANGSNVLVAGAGSIYRSINGGSSWTTSVTGAGIGEDFIASLAIDPLATNIVYAGDFHIDGGSTATDLIAKSVDGGATFTNIINPSSSSIRAYYLQVDPAISGTLYAAGSGTPNVAKSTNNGFSWTSVSPVGGYPQSLALAPSSTLVLYLGMRNISNSNSIGIYKSINGGSNWTPMNTGLPATLPDISALLVDPADVNRVHAGTAAGYYASTNGGSNWALGPSGGAYPSASLQFGELAQTSTRRLVGIAPTGIYLLPFNASPSISNVSPLVGSSAGGDSVTVTGSGFTIASGLRVVFGGTDATVNLGASTPTSIVVTTPAHAAGTVDVVVVNPDGQAGIRTSAFTFNVCTFQLSPASASYSSSAATGTVTVTAPQGCSWTASAPGGSFVSITAGASGSGNGSVSYSVLQNSTGALRSTTLTIAGQSFDVTQSASGTALFALSATASPTQVALSWASIGGGGTSYEVRRSSGGGSFNLLTTTTLLAYTDTAISAGTGYLYRIDAIGIGSSNVDLAVPFVYTDPTIAIGSTPIRAVHFTELRQAANAARTAVGLAPMTFTGTIASGVVVQRIHLMELRSTVDGVRGAVGLAPVPYTDGVVTAGTTIIRRAHILDLRGGLQ